MDKLNIEAFFQDTAPILPRFDDLVNTGFDLSTTRPLVEEILKRAIVPYRFREEMVNVFTEALDAHTADHLAEWLGKN